MQVMKDWHRSHPHLFVKSSRNHAGRDTALISPHYLKAGSKGGRPPMPLGTMLRLYFVQNWYAPR